MLRQSVNTNLLHGGGKTIEVRGSTDGGATWPYLVGDDTLTEAALPWATNQRNVRLAWIYKGPIQYGRYWCIDDVEIWAKHSRERDLSVSEVRCPRGVLTQGTTLTPSVFVWNHGRVTESIPVTMTIGGYSSTRWAKLYPYNDTLLEFASWSATPGNYTATCCVGLPEDECRANDTASLTFRVAADTWVAKYPTYGGGTMSGACLTTVGTNDIYCVTGRKNFFARYLVAENLWKNRTPTPAAFDQGGGIAYAGGDYLYAVRGSTTRNFYRYRISTGRWSQLPDLAEKIRNGGALVYGGNGYLYALRGGLKKDFYRYSISGNSWQAKAQTPANIGGGGSLAWTGGDHIYALRGSGTRDFYRYQISTNQWTMLASTPKDVSRGAALVYYPAGNKLYAFFGDSYAWFYAYNITGNSWSSRRSAPYEVKDGACLTCCDYSVFGSTGIGRSGDFWRYSPPVGGDEGQEEPEPVAPVLTRNAAGLPPPAGYGEELLTYDPADKFTPQWSPDDQWISYAVYDSAIDCIVLRKVGTSSPSSGDISIDTLTHERAVWSADGNWLVAAADSGIYRLASDGSSEELIAAGVGACPLWTSADEWVVYSKWDSVLGTHNIWKVRSDGTEDVCIRSGPDEYLQPQPLNDSEVVCVKLKDEVYQLCLVSPNEEKWLTSDYCDNINPSLSPDRQWVTFEKFDETNTWQAYKMRVDGSEETRLTQDGAHHTTPVYSPDGGYIAYARWPIDTAGGCALSQICYVPADGGKETALHPADAVRENPAWSPTSEYIVYQLETEAGDFGPRRRVKQLARTRTGLRPWLGQEELGPLPRVFALYQNRPNPFRTTTAIRYAIPAQSRVELNIYDVTGRQVRTLVSTPQRPGYYSAVWTGTDDRGRSVASGTYYYILKADGRIAQKRMLLVR